MSKTETFVGTLAVLLVVFVSTNFYMNWKQQEALEILVSNVTVVVEHEQTQETRIWDLHRRMMVLETRTVALNLEDERLLAHIKWFVMRRSGTNELRKMEAAVARLEAE